MKQYQDRDWLYQKYWKERLSLPQIAKECKASPLTIWKWMNKLGINRRTISEARKGQHCSEETKRKISKEVKKAYQLRKTRKNPYLSYETMKKMSEEIKKIHRLRKKN